MTMEEIRNVIEEYIRIEEKVGDQTGGSGHLSNKNIKLFQISEPIPITKNLKSISFKYAVFILTEFTYYPDNPPYETHYAQTIIIDNSGKIIEINSKEMIDPVPNISIFPNFKLPDEIS